MYKINVLLFLICIEMLLLCVLLELELMKAVKVLTQFSE